MVNFVILNFVLQPRVCVRVWCYRTTGHKPWQHPHQLRQRLPNIAVATIKRVRQISSPSTVRQPMDWRYVHVYARLIFNRTCLINKTLSLLFSAHVVRLPVLRCLVLQQCNQCCVGNNCNRRLLTGGATSNHVTTSVTAMAVAIATALLLLRH